MPRYGAALSLRLSSLRGVGGYIGPVANNTMVPTSLSATGQVEQSTIHTVRAPNGIHDIQLVFAGWYAGGTFILETPLASTYTFEAALEYPVGSGTWTRITTAGANIGTAAVGVNNYTDLTPISNVPDGADFRLWYRLVGASIPRFTPGTAKALAADEGSNNAAGSTSVPKAVTDNNSLTLRCGPVAIFGTRSGDSVAILGDSQAAFATGNLTSADTVPSHHNRGDVAATIGGTYAHLNLGVGATSWEACLQSFANRKELALKATIILDEMGLNSMLGWANTAGDSLTNKQRSLPMWNGKKVIATKITPNTTGAWTLADGSDQAISTAGAAAPGFNAGLTYSGVLPTPLDRYTPVNNVTTTNKWAADGTVKKYTVDGTHLSSYAAYTAMPANSATWLAQLAALTPVATFTQPSVDMTGGATLSGGYLVNGTVSQNTTFPAGGIFTFTFRLKVLALPGATYSLLPNLSNGYMKAIFITTAGILQVFNAANTILPSLASVADNTEHEVTVTGNGPTMELFIDGASQGTVANTATNFATTKFQVAASANVFVRELTLWNFRKWTTTYTPALFTGNEAGLIARWPLATNLAGTAGPGLPA